jgi:hypothetical protein
MSEHQGTIGIRIPRAFILLVGAAVGILFGLVLLMMTGRPAGAAVLPGLPSSPITQTAAPVVTTLSGVTQGLVTTVSDTVPAATNNVLSPVLPSLGSTVSSTSAGLVSGTTGAVQSLGAPNGPAGLVSGAAVPALPVLSSSPPALLGGIVSQGSRPTPTEPSPPQSAANAGVALRTGSAAFFSLGMSTQSALVSGPQTPSSPQPRRPTVPVYPPVPAGATSGSGAHNGPLDSLPPTILVLALLVAAGMGLERRQRPKARFDLRFSPPG